MDINLLNTARGLQPLYDEDFDEKKKLKVGEVYRAKIVRPRNIKFHRKFFALIKIGHENTKSVEMPLDAYRKYAIMKSGFIDLYATPKGTLILPKSIAFDSMTEDEFEQVYNKVLDFIIKDTEATKEDIENNLIDFM
jgi:hypothetical protein